MVFRIHLPLRKYNTKASMCSRGSRPTPSSQASNLFLFLSSLIIHIPTTLPCQFNRRQAVVGQFGTGQLGTRAIWHQHYKTDNLAHLSGAKLSWCQIVRVPNCPFLLFWCQIVRFIILVPNCLVPNCTVLQSK